MVTAYCVILSLFQFSQDSGALRHVYLTTNVNLGFYLMSVCLFIQGTADGTQGLVPARASGLPLICIPSLRYYFLYYIYLLRVGLHVAVRRQLVGVISFYHVNFRNQA